jgi:hypothetical protein
MIGDKFKRSWHKHGSDFPFWFYNETGATGGMYNAKHYWFGIKGVFGIRYSVEW